jgi:hypothetical protein
MKRDGIAQKYLFVTLFFTLFAVSGCSSVSVFTDYDHAVDFTKYKKYCWCYQSVIPGDRLAQLPLVKKRVMNAVDMVMKSKGYVMTKNDNADFYISVHAGTRDKTRIRSTPMFYDPYWGPVGGRVSVDDYTEGTLYIDIIDAATRHMSWRGVGKDIIKEYDNGDQMQITINKMVAEILKKFPPGNRK